jgi:hypothetical protein
MRVKPSHWLHEMDIFKMFIKSNVYIDLEATPLSSPKRNQFHFSHCIY